MKNRKRKVAGIGIVFISCAFFSNFSNAFAQISKEPQKETPISIDCLDKNIEIATSYEEKIIRLAYKKLTLYNIVSRYRDGKNLKEVLDNSIKFKLSDFKSGSIDEIKDVLYNDLTSPPNEEIIQLSRSTIQETVNKVSREEQIAYRAEWIPGKYSTIFDRSWTIEDVVKIETLKYYDVKLYTSYKVTVSLDGRSRSYSALVLYHGQPENLKLKFLDRIAGLGGNLTHAWEEQRLPFGLNRRSINKTEETYSNDDFENKVKKYLTDSKNDLISTEPAVSCPKDTSNLQKCCLAQDLANFWDADSCNGWWIDINSFVRNTANSSIQSFIPFYSSDNQYHIGGGVHHGRARFYPQCTIESATTQRCDVQIRDQGYGDTQNDHSDWYYHVGNAAETSRGNDG